MTSRSYNQECMEEFIEIYRNEHCLWQMKCKEYHDRGKREAAYSKLVEKLKGIEPSANRESVVKKINNIRSNYRKELKKVKASSKSGSGSDEIYEPKLWYFKLLTFLNEQDIPRTSCSNIESDDGEAFIEEQATEITSGDSIPDGSIADAGESPICTRDENLPESSASTVLPNCQRPQKRSLQSSSSHQAALTKEVLLSVRNHFKRPANLDDRFDIFGRNVAMKLRDLPKQQRLLAEKFINEALFQAEMGTLTMSHVLNCPNPHRMTPSPPPMRQLYLQHMYSYDSATPSPTTPSPPIPRGTTTPNPIQQYPQRSSTASSIPIQSSIPEDSSGSLLSNFSGDDT